jgi:CHAT domain-containing protein
VSPRPRVDFVPLIAEHEIISLPSASVLGVLRRELADRAPAPKLVAVLADPVFEPTDLRVKRGGSTTQKPASDQVQTTGDGDLRQQAIRRSLDESGVTQTGLPIPRLTYSRQEAASIVALVPAHRRKLALDFEASRATATSPDLSQYRILHFATHGLLNSQHPELSGLLLSLVDEAGRPQPDGILHLGEIYNLKLPAEVVVLSACQTALGKEVKGEGLVGLTRGFMYAGARRVMASLWRVEDEATAELMKRLYQGMLRDGLRPAAALRRAQVAMWKEKKVPYDWAAFVLQGEWR